jgi:hypothetical protein
MADFPYSTNPASVKRFLGDIQRIGKPPKVTIKWIQGLAACRRETHNGLYANETKRVFADRPTQKGVKTL